MKLEDFQWDSLYIWVDKQTGAGTEGKIGMDQFDSRWISIDYDRQELSLSDEMPPGLDASKALTLETHRDILFLNAELEIEGERFGNRFMIHSGFNGSIMLDDAFASEHALAEKLEVISTQEMMDAQGNKLSSVKTRGANFLVAGQSIEDVEVNFFTGSIGRMQMSIIGSEILSSFNPVIDLEDKRIWLRPRES